MNWTSPRGNTLQNSCCVATYYPSRKLPKLDEPDMRYTVGDRFRRILYMDEQMQDDQLESIYSIFCVDTGCSLADLPGAMDDRDGWQEKVQRDPY